MDAIPPPARRGNRSLRRTRAARPRSRDNPGADPAAHSGVGGNVSRSAYSMPMDRMTAFGPTYRTFPTLGIAAFSFMKEQVDRLRLARIETDDVYGVSFNPGRDIQGPNSDDAEHRLCGLMSTWSRKLDTRGLGFARQRLHQWKHRRPAYLLVAQQGARTWHLHGVAFVPRLHVEAFECWAKRLWSTVTPGGDMDMDPIPDARWLGYINRHVKQDQPFNFQIIPDPEHRTRLAA